MSQVLIVGGGVSGLTCALQLLRAGFDVQVWRTARGQAPPNWVWEYPPYPVEPQEKACQWARVSLDEFTQLSKASDSNVHIIPVIVLSKDQLAPNPGADFLPHFKHGREALAEARRLLWSDEPTERVYADAQYYLAPVCNSVKYLEWLQTQIKAMGGRIVTRTVSSIRKAASESTAKVVVNCSGMGAKEIVPDPTVYPCRGELVHVHAPWVQAAVFDDLDAGYVIACPGSDLELGGTADDHAYERKFTKVKY